MRAIGRPSNPFQVVRYCAVRADMPSNGQGIRLLPVSENLPAPDPSRMHEFA